MGKKYTISRYGRWPSWDIRGLDDACGIGGEVRILMGLAALVSLIIAVVLEGSGNTESATWYLVFWVGFNVLALKKGD